MRLTTSIKMITENIKYLNLAQGLLSWRSSSVHLPIIFRFVLFLFLLVLFSARSSLRISSVWIVKRTLKHLLLFLSVYISCLLFVLDKNWPSKCYWWSEWKKISVLSSRFIFFKLHSGFRWTNLIKKFFVLSPTGIIKKNSRNEFYESL